MNLPGTSYQSFDATSLDLQPQSPVCLAFSEDVDSRFANLTEEELKAIEDGRNAANTKLLTVWAVGLLEQFIEKKNFEGIILRTTLTKTFRMLFSWSAHRRSEKNLRNSLFILRFRSKRRRYRIQNQIDPVRTSRIKAIFPRQPAAWHFWYVNLCGNGRKSICGFS